MFVERTVEFPQDLVLQLQRWGWSGHFLVIGCFQIGNVFLFARCFPVSCNDKYRVIFLGSSPSCGVLCAWKNASFVQSI